MELHLKCVNSWINAGTFVKSLSDKSNSLNADMLGAKSWGIDGNSLFPNFNTRKYGSGNSGTVLSDTFSNPSLTKLFCSPIKALSRTLRSSLWDKSNTDKRGSVAKAASSSRYNLLNDKFKLESAYY